MYTPFDDNSDWAIFTAARPSEVSNIFFNTENFFFRTKETHIKARRLRCNDVKSYKAVPKPGTRH